MFVLKIFITGDICPFGLAQGVEPNLNPNRKPE